jgi:hypothetical protein
MLSGLRARNVTEEIGGAGPVDFARFNRRLVFIIVLIGVLSIPVPGAVLSQSILDPGALRDILLLAHRTVPATLQPLKQELTQTISGSLRWSIGLTGAWIALSLALYAAFAVLILRSYLLLGRMGIKKRRFGPLTAVLIWLVPIVNLVLPRAMIAEVWSGSSPGTLLDRRVASEEEETDAISVIWLFYVLSIGWIYCFLVLSAVLFLADLAGLSGYFRLLTESGAARLVMPVLVVASTASVLFAFQAGTFAGRLLERQVARKRLLDHKLARHA